MDQAAVARAQELMRQGEAERDPEKSTALLEEALSIFDTQLPTVPQAMRAPLMIARGGVLLRLTRYAEALEVADASLAEMPESAQTAKLREKAQRLATRSQAYSHTRPMLMIHMPPHMKFVRSHGH